MRKVLNKAFFDRKTEKVAKELLGKYLVRKIGNNIVRERITEVEAYIGPHDLASHASKGRTNRTDVMFQRAGTIYVYLIYGMYWMLNIVTEEDDYPSAILIRGTESASRRIKGPGILTRELKIDKKLNGKMIGKASGLWFEYPSSKLEAKSYKLLQLPRIGVNYAGPVWANKKLRFLLKEK